MRYNKEKVDKDEAEVLFWQKIQEPYDKCGSLDIDACMESFIPYLETNRRTTNTVFHASLNPSPEDRLTDEQLRDIAQEYMELWVTATSPTLSLNIRTLTGNICISYHYELMRTAVKSKIHTTFSVRRICNQTTNSQIELDQFVTRLITSVTIVIESLHTTDYFCYAK